MAVVQLSTEIENGNAVYESDETINFRNELNGKFYVIKPKTLELPSLTYASLDNILIEQRDRIKDWLKSHGSNAEAVARYNAQLEEVESALEELNLVGEDGEIEESIRNNQEKPIISKTNQGLVSYSQI